MSCLFDCILFSKFTHVVACIRMSSPLWLNNISLYVLTLFIDLWRVLCFHLLVIGNNAAMNIGRQVSEHLFLIAWGFYLGIAGSHGNCMFNLFRNIKISPQQLWHFTFALTCKGLFPLIRANFPLLKKYNHPSRCKVLSHFAFDSHFPNDEWCWASFRVHIGHLFIFFGEMFI